MSDLKDDDGKQAIYCLEHLLYEIPFSALHNVAALLAQETGQSVTDFGQSMGHWTFDVVQRFLWERGYKCVPTVCEKKWCLDKSPNFLRRDAGFVGFICRKSLVSYKWYNNQWHDSAKKAIDDIHPLLHDAVVVHRMWAAVEPYYAQDRPYYVTSDIFKYTRSECDPKSCWQTERVCYEGRRSAVKAYMREHRKNAIMMSNEHEMVLCRPTKRGWETETLLNYECMALKPLSERVLEVIMKKLAEIIDQDRVCLVMGHAFYSVLSYVGGRLTPEDCSLLSPEEIETLRNYEMGLTKVEQTLSSE